MAAQVAVAVVGHRARQYQAHRLATSLDARLFLDNGQLGEWANHRRAWMWLADQDTDWGLVLQDDAVPVDGMLGHLAAGLESLPDPGLVSLYLGTGYPRHWQPRIRKMLARAGTASWARGGRLLHGVAVAAPTTWAADLVASEVATLPYDEHLSWWAKVRDVPVFYTLPSMVDHADQPTLVRHADGQPRTRPRHAHRVGVPAWDRGVIRF